jgi:hypothetical protein
MVAAVWDGVAVWSLAACLCRALLSCRFRSGGPLNIHAVSAVLLTSHFLALLVVPLTRTLVIMFISMAMDVTIRSRHGRGWHCAVLSCPVRSRSAIMACW